MHLTTCSSFAALWRRTGDERAERFLRRVVEREVIFASCTSEAGFGGALEDCATIATPVAGGFRLDGRKIFFTESDVATHFTTCARLEHPELGPHMVFFNGIPVERARPRDRAHLGHARHASDAVERSQAGRASSCRGRRSSTPIPWAGSTRASASRSCR